MYGLAMFDFSFFGVLTRSYSIPASAALLFLDDELDV
jgi:hypothetical protein